MELTTHQKALEINLNPQIYGTFAEIGAGQEVVRWFFRVGGAAGTVTKSMSAYDMNVSDAIYGKSARYVSESRLIQMLDHEYSLNLERLGKLNRSLFAFADTIATKSYKGNNEPHGWMGLRFQMEAGSEPSQIIIHVRMLDREATNQQEALGIVGVNLLYAAYYIKEDFEKFILSLIDGLNTERVQIDLIEFSGPGFKNVDNRLMTLYLVKNKLSEIAMFDAKGDILQPAEVLYKKPVLIERGSFRPVTNTHLRIFESSKKAFKNDFPEHAENCLYFMEITMKNLLESSELSASDFLARADTLAAINQPVLISHYSEFYKLSTFLRRYTSMPIAFALGGASLKLIMQDSDYKDLEGGFLEAAGKLFRENVRMYIYPQIIQDGSRITAESFIPDEKIEFIYKHLLKNKHLLTLEAEEKEYMPSTSKDILPLMQSNNPAWRSLVPPAVVRIIEERKLFGCNK